MYGIHNANKQNTVIFWC